MFILLFLGALQGLLGWYMVKSGLNQLPRVSHYRLAAHLMSALTVLGFTSWTAFELIYPAQLKTPEKGTVRTLSISLFIIVLVQIIYGAFVAGLKAGVLCPTWPKMCDEWIPDSVLTLQPVWKNAFEYGAGVQFVHRYIACLVVLLISATYFRSTNDAGLSSLQRRIINALGIIVLCQFTLGILTLLNGVPVLLAILHQTGAILTFIACLFLIFSFRIQK